MTAKAEQLWWSSKMPPVSVICAVAYSPVAGGFVHLITSRLAKSTSHQSRICDFFLPGHSLALQIAGPPQNLFSYHGAQRLGSISWVRDRGVQITRPLRATTGTAYRNKTTLNRLIHRRLEQASAR